ncbi:MAG: hypothetical protein K2Y29_00415 [Beijerinckiaceae bacterium]|nr:hypothetical protein [Beijerinckiaceae bacterium]
MAALTDIAPTVRFVTVGALRIEVYGISVRGFAHLLGRFPELRKLMSGVQPDPAALMDMFPDAIAAIIAAGTGKPGDPAAEAVADGLPVETQLDFLAEIIPLSMPSGIVPFGERLTSLMGSLGVVSEPQNSGPVTS